MPSLNELVRSHTDLDEAGRRVAAAAAWRTGRSSPTCPSPTWCCGCPTGRAAATGRARRCGRRPGRRRTSTTWSARSSRPAAGRCSTRAYARARLAREGDPEWRDDVPVRVETIPVRRGDRVIAVVARNTNLLGVRTPSRLELSYLQTRRRPDPDDRPRLLPGPPGSAATTPTRRASGTASCASTPTGRVVYASPNALSVYRRLGLSGDLAGLSLADLTRELVPAATAPRRGDAQRRARRPAPTATPRSAPTRSR